MVGGDDYADVLAAQHLQQLVERTELEPREGDVAIGGLVLRQFFYHLDFGAGVRQHVDEVVDEGVEVVVGVARVYLV